jgi:hypothetical protein
LTNKTENLLIFWESENPYITKSWSCLPPAVFFPPDFKIERQTRRSIKDADGSRSALAAPTAQGNVSRRQLHKSLFEAQSNRRF